MARHPLLQKKRRQHHVWQYYLKAWTSSDGQLFVRQDETVRPSGTTNIAVEKDFYKMSALTRQEIDFIRKEVIAKSNPFARQLLEDFLDRLVRPVAIFDKMRDIFAKGGLDADNVIDTFMTNALEDHHMRIENGFLPILEKVRSGDISFYEDQDERITFLHFVCHQFFRTKAIKERVIALMRSDNVGIEKTWDIIACMSAVNVGASLYVEKSARSLRLLRSNGEVEFITGDQPVMNLHSGQDAAQNFSLYYPISPDLAVLMAEPDVDFFESQTLAGAEVGRLNARVAEVRHRQLFGRSANALTTL